MPEDSPNPKYHGIKLPAQMYEACKTIIKEHPECGWKSVSDFVRDAIRHYEYWKKYAFSSQE